MPVSALNLDWSLIINLYVDVSQSRQEVNETSQQGRCDVCAVSSSVDSSGVY